MLLAVLCDLGPTQGVGHVMRCVALAEEFASRGHEVVFVADVASVPFAAGQLAARGFRALPPPQAPEQYDALLASLSPTTIVVDSYVLPVSVYAAACATATTVAMVDGDPAGRPAHVYVDQNIGAESDQWELPEGSRRLAGLTYALQRDEILALRDAPRPPESDPLKVFAFFGGTDAYGAGPVLAEALARTGLPYDLTRVDPTVTEPTGDRIPPTTELARHVAEADLVISAAGTSSWELLCLGAACALVAVADNQAASYARIAATGTIRPLGYLAGLRDDLICATDELRALLTDATLRKQLREAGRTLVDGQGRARVADVVLALD